MRKVIIFEYSCSMNSAVLKLFLLHILGTIKSVDMQSYFKLELRGFMEHGRPNYIQFVTEIDPKTRTNKAVIGTLTDLEMKGRIPQNNQPSVSDVGKSTNNENKNLKRKDPSADVDLNLEWSTSTPEDDVDLTLSLGPSRKIFKSSIPNIDQNSRFANPQGSLHQAYSIGATQARDPQQPDDKNKPAVLMKSFSDSTKAARPGLPSGDLISGLLPRSYNLGGSKLSATASGISSHGKESHIGMSTRQSHKLSIVFAGKPGAPLKVQLLLVVRDYFCTTSSATSVHFSMDKIYRSKIILYVPATTNLWCNVRY